MRRDAIARTREVVAYDNPYMTLYDDEVRFPDGHHGRYLRADWKSGFSVAVLAITEKLEYVLVNQFAYALDDFIVQVPKGMGLPGTAPADVAARELLEETGYASTDLRELCSLIADPGFSANPTHVFLATNARRAAPPTPERTELIRSVELVPIQVARRTSWLHGARDLLTRFCIEHHRPETQEDGVNP